VVPDRHGTLAARRPDAPQDRLEADAVLVGGEGLDYGAGMARRPALRAFSAFIRPTGANDRCATGCEASATASARFF
jgi:hypothetical protein